MFSKYIVTPLILAASVLSAPAALVPRQSCSSLQLVHLAGTTEVGLGTVGTPLSRALASAVPGTTTKSIAYSTIAEYAVTVEQGASTTTQYLKSQSAACPDQRFVLSGYSKGALVLHRMNLDNDVKSKVAGVLVFGDPLRGMSNDWPINNASVNMSPKDGNSGSQNTASFCNTGDLFCFRPGTSLPAHLAYPMDGSIAAAASFIKAAI